jgi:hypothetical protein
VCVSFTKSKNAVFKQFVIEDENSVFLDLAKGRVFFTHPDQKALPEPNFPS